MGGRVAEPQKPFVVKAFACPPFRGQRGAIKKRGAAAGQFMTLPPNFCPPFFSAPESKTAKNPLW